MAASNARQLNLDCQNLLAYRPSNKLHGLLVDYPAEVLPLLDFSLNEFFLDLFPDVDLKGDSLMVRDLCSLPVRCGTTKAFRCG